MIASVRETTLLLGNAYLGGADPLGPAAAAAGAGFSYSIIASPA
jgi:hypothetical protein